MYEKRIERRHPGAIVFLVDQSESMRDPLAGTSLTKAAAVAEELNTILQGLIARCTKDFGEPPRRFFAISVIGYSTDPDGAPRVGSLFQGELAQGPWAWTDDLAQRPLRIEQRTRALDGAAAQSYATPVWLDPFASGGTPMCSALDYTGRLVRAWCDQYRGSFPPIVINLSDGESTDGDPREWARRLRSLKTDDGNVLFFNLGIGGTGATHLFLSSPPRDASPFTAVLWEMSSELPSAMADLARHKGFGVTAAARGFGVNADFRSVVEFLNIGTRVDHLLR